MFLLLEARVDEEGERADPTTFSSSVAVSKNLERDARGWWGLGGGGQTMKSGVYQEHNIYIFSLWRAHNFYYSSRTG